jgi:DNA repair exonuclease SbcCD nuclease subunit
VILAHLSDLHLGHRAYERVEGGWNVRERDVALAFERAVQELVPLRPDVVIVAGDVFDRPDPPTTALVTFTRALETLRVALPASRVLMVAGARDTPRRSGDPGILAALDALPGVHAASAEPRSVLLEELSLQALLLPHAALRSGLEGLPVRDPRFRHHLLVAHGRLDPGAATFIDPREWDYVALGGEHSQRAVGSNAAWSGALERVGPEPWSEAAEGKGFFTVELPGARRTFHAVPGRGVVALAPIRVQGGADRVRERIREVTDEVPGGIEDKIVLLRLTGIRPRELTLLQGELLADLRRRALHLVVQVETPRGARPPGPADALLRVREALAAAGADTPARLDRLERLTRTRGGRT